MNPFYIPSDFLVGAFSQQALRKSYYPGKRIIYLMGNTSGQLADRSQPAGKIELLLQLLLLILRQVLLSRFRFQLMELL